MIEGLNRKKEQAMDMFKKLVEFMNLAQAMKIERDYTLRPSMPEWLK